MVYFQKIRKTRHYREHHESEVPWHEAIEALFATKNPRRNGDVFEIDNKNIYVIFKVENSVLFVINAKRK
ncbi:MAG TPA: hypothetical protein VI934_02290 [Candidatus Nanoarchaeia archaeon]|nr:hypothetical protein [Candidatus Nanoarchaeia archaeon]